MLTFLLSIVGVIWNGWLSFKASVSERLGKSEQKNEDLSNVVKQQAAELEAAANAPKDKTAMEKLLEEGKL